MVMYMYDNAFETKKIKFKPRMERNHNVYTVLFSYMCDVGFHGSSHVAL